MSFPASMPQPPQQVGGIPDFSTVDPASLAPMELYDSIFWGKLTPQLFPFPNNHMPAFCAPGIFMGIPCETALIARAKPAGPESPDPFYNVADMNFEFLPQAPPGQSQQQQFYF